MAQPSMLSTPLDIRNLSEHLSPDRISYPRLSVFIHKADSLIRNGLRDFYSIDSGLLESAPWNGPPQDAYGVADTASNTGTKILSDVTVSASAITEMWTLTFTSATAYTITGSLSGSQGTGATGSSSASTNSYLTVPTANWSGTAVANDVIYVATYIFKPLLVTLSSLWAAGLALISQYEGDNKISAKGTEYINEAKKVLKALQMPYSDNGMSLDSFSARDVSPEGLGYVISNLGIDVSSYADNEQTDVDDSQEGI